MALGFKEFRAIVVQISKERRLLRSLVENMARRFPSRGLSTKSASKKHRDITIATSGESCDIDRPQLLDDAFKSRRERLLDAALHGKIPLGVAMDIAKTKTA